MDCLAETGLTPLSSILVAVIALALIGAGLLVMRRQRRAGIAAIAVLALLLGGGLALGPAHTATAASADCSAATSEAPVAAPVPAPTATPSVAPSQTPAPSPTPTPTPTAPACVPGAPVEPTSSVFRNTGEGDQVDAQFFPDYESVVAPYTSAYASWALFSGAQAEALVAALGITVTAAPGATVALTAADVPAVPTLDVIPTDEKKLTLTATTLLQGTLSRSNDGVLTIDLRHDYTVSTEDMEVDFILPHWGEWEGAQLTWHAPGNGMTCDGTPLLDTVVTDGMLD